MQECLLLCKRSLHFLGQVMDELNKINVACPSPHAHTRLVTCAEGEKMTWL